MKAIILAAGKAARLLPHTKDMPQCLLKLGKKTFLEHQATLLRKGGVSDITVVTGHLSEMIEIHCVKIGLKTIFNPFYEISGMAMSLWGVRQELTDGFVLLYSDVLFDPKIVKDLIRMKGDIVLAVRKNKLRDEAEKVIETDGQIRSISKEGNESANSEYIGIAKFSPAGAKRLISVLESISRTDLNCSFINTVNKLIEDGSKIGTYDIGDMRFLDVDFPEDLERAKEFV